MTRDEELSLVPKEKTIPEIIKEKATIYSVSSEVMFNVIKCESAFNKNAIGDQGHSFGLSQIHLPSNPTVTKEQAFDPEFAINFMAQEMSHGNSWKWSCWKILYK